MARTYATAIRLAAGLAVAAAATSAAGAADTYLKLGGVQGDSARGKGETTIKVESWSWGESNTGTSAGARTAVGGAPASGSVVSPRDSASGLPTGKRQHKPMVITKELDKSTPVLMQAGPPPSGSLTLRGVVSGCSPGTYYPSAVLTTRTHRYEFAGVTVASCGSGGGGGAGGAVPMEQISLNYAKVVVRSWDPATKKE